MNITRRDLIRASLAFLPANLAPGAFAQAPMRRVVLSMPKLICQAKTEGTDDEIYLVLAGKTSHGQRIMSHVPTKSHWDLNEGDAKKAEISDVTLWESDLPPGTTVDLTLFVLEQDESPSEHSWTLANVVADRTVPGGPTIGVVGDVEKLRSDCFPHTGNPSFEVKAQPGTMELFGLQTNIPRKSVTYGFSLYDTDDCPGIVGIRLSIDAQGVLKTDYLARARCEDKGWVESKLPAEMASPPSFLIPPELQRKLADEELGRLRVLSNKPTRQFWCKGDGSFYRLFLRSVIT